MRKYYWYISTFFRKHGIIVLTTVIGAIIIFSLFLPVFLRIFEFKKHEYIGLIGKYTLESLPRVVQSELSSGLTNIQEDGSATSALAERWNTEDDGKTYRFVLRKGITWQDGKELVPSDVSYNFNDVQLITT